MLIHQPQTFALARGQYIERRSALSIILVHKAKIWLIQLDCPLICRWDKPGCDVRYAPMIIADFESAERHEKLQTEFGG
jgi:hypothetical protein